MQKEQYDALQDWFNNYVRSAYLEAPGFEDWIALKNKHTQRVCHIITQIGCSLHLPDEDLLLAGAVALLHDVGRFRQIKLYGTFNDRNSENHATLGIKVLNELEVLKLVAKGDADIIVKAVELHNLRDLPNDLPDRILLFAQLIQDADKLDIIRLFTLHYCGTSCEYGTVLDTNLPDTQGYNAELVEDILAERLGNYKDVKNRSDRKLLHLSWVFGIHFNFTLSEIERGGYVSKIIESLPCSDDIVRIHRLIETYMSGNF